MRLLSALALAALLVGASASAGGAHAAKPRKPKITLAASVKFTNKAAGRVSVRGVLRVNGRRHPAIIHYQAVTRDAYRYACGSPQGGRAGVLELKYPQAYSVDVTVKAVAEVAGKRVRRSGGRRLVIGNRTMNCHAEKPGDQVPPWTAVCMYQFRSGPANPSNNLCGVPTGPDGKPSQQPEKLPYWSGPPVHNGTTIYAPSFVSPTGPCKLYSRQDAIVSWLGNRVSASSWDCPGNINVEPEWFIYLASEDPADGKGGPYYPSCQVGDFVVLPPPPNSAGIPTGGTFTHFTLPSNWRGRVDVELRMKLFLVGGPYQLTYLGSEYSDMSFYPNPGNPAGTVDGCPELLAAGR